MFFKDILSAGRDADKVKGPDFKKQLETVRQFRIYLETTLRHIGNRAEPRDKEIDTKRVESLIKQYM